MDERNPLTFHKEKLRLRELHKRLRVGLVHWDDVDPQDQALLIKFYGW